MGIKYTFIHKMVSAGLVLSFCGLTAITAFSQDKSDDLAAVKNKKVVKTYSFNEDVKHEFSPASSKKQSSSSSSNSWTGFYVGGYLGGTMGRSNANTSTVYSSTGYFSTTSVPAINSAGAQRIKSGVFTGGGGGGYNYQSGKWVIGAEADFGSQRLSDFASTTATYPCCSPSTFTIAQRVSTNWLFTARPRAGYVFGKALVYATGGLAVTDITYTSVFSDNFASAFEANVAKENKFGWTGGGGVEFKVAKKWSVKGEYLFSDFGRLSNSTTGLSAPGTTPHPTNIFTHSSDLKTSSFRFGINYHF